MNPKKQKQKVWIWGAGYYSSFVADCVSNDFEILGYIDRKADELCGAVRNNVVTAEVAQKKKYDFIVVSVYDDASIEKEIERLNIDKEKVVFFWRLENSSTVIKSRSEIILKLLHEKDVLRARLSSAPYEWGIKYTPDIRSIEELIEKIKQERRSLCRFGDGEFDIMLGRGNPKFQKADSKLRSRLIEIICSNDNKISIAIAQNFRYLERFTEEAADEIRIYMEHKREDIMNLLSKEVTYYDAYISRPYILWEDKKKAFLRFEELKKIFHDRSLLIVEGINGHMGVGNDLLQHAASINRIICPEENAWNLYEKIYKKTIEHAKKNDLVCASLGPTATVLAYDLAKAGVQALDIGQIDNEYEWFLCGTNKRISIPGKRVAEIDEDVIDDVYGDEVYEKQIVERIR